MYTKMIVLPAFVFALIASLFLNSSKLSQQPEPDTKTAQPVAVATTTLTTYSASDVSTHNTATSCWSIIGKNVYDLTAYLPRHPGGPGAILQICGKDGTSRFLGQHGADNGANKALERLKIGTLK